jgi:hypothetical protein
MLEPLTALSVASSVVQFVDYGTGLIDRAYKIYKSSTGSTGETEELEMLVKRFAGQAYIVELFTKTGPLETPSQDEEATIALAKSCRTLADRFLTLLQSLKIQPKAGKVESLALSARIGWKRKDIAQFQHQLEALRADLNTPLLITLCNPSSRVAQALAGLQRQDSLREMNLTAKINAIKSDLEQSLRSSSSAPPSLQQLTALEEEARRVSNAQEVLTTLAFQSMEERRSSIVERYAHTYEWIYDDTDTLEQRKGLRVELRDWLEKRTGVFWVSGKAGSGKSTLMKFLLDYRRTEQALRKWSGADKLVIGCHFFWNAGSSLQKSQKGLLRALCYEVLKRCPDLIPEVCEERASKTAVLTTRTWVRNSGRTRVYS